MHARAALATALVLAGSLSAVADDAQTDVRAAIAPNGDPVRLTVTSGGKKPGISLAVGKAKPVALHAGEGVGTLKVGHGKTVVAFAVDKNKTAFNIHVAGGETATLARPTKRADFPYAVVMTPTPTGFTVFFQDVEAENTNEAHTYMVELDKEGKPDGEPREVQVPWALGDAAWNGNGYHLALYFAGGGNGVRLSMVSLDKNGLPEQHPDWASAAGLVSEVHLVAGGGKIRAFYRGGMGDRLLESDVTKIRGWGSEPPNAKDHGALRSSQAIAIDAGGKPKKLKR